MLLFLFRYSSLSGTDKLDGIVDDTSMPKPHNNAILTRASLKIVIITLRKYVFGVGVCMVYICIRIDLVDSK